MLLVDKSLVVAEDSQHGTRYRLLETVRQYAQEKLHESREGDDVRCRHRDHYTAMAALLDAPADDGYEAAHRAGGHRNRQSASRFRVEPGTLGHRAGADAGVGAATALAVTGAHPGRAELARCCSCRCGARRCADVSAARVRASVDRSVLLSFSGMHVDLDEAERTLAAARELGDPALVARALTACGAFADADRELGGAYFAEAAGIARDIGDSWWLGQTLALEGDVRAPLRRTRRYGAGGRRGRTSDCRRPSATASSPASAASSWAGLQILRGDLTGAVARLREVGEEYAATHDAMFSLHVSNMEAIALAYLGHLEDARTTAEVARQRASDFFDSTTAAVHAGFAHVHLAAGDAGAAWEAFEAGARAHRHVRPDGVDSTIWRPLPRWHVAISTPPVAGPTTSCR